MKLFATALMIFLSLAAHAQPKVINLDKAAIPKSIKYTGHIVKAVKFSDNNGENLVLMTETGQTPSKIDDGNDSRDAALYAYHYLNQSGIFKLTWTVHDFEKNCPVDIAAKFIDNTFGVTDLDNNGTAEIWMMYKTVCHGDVSPYSLKIIMYEGAKKHAMRGLSLIKVKGMDTEGGKYTFDSAFQTTLWHFATMPLIYGKRIC